MAYDGPQPVKWTFPAAGNIATSYAKFVKLNSSGQVTAVTGTTDRVIGVLANKPTVAGQAAEVIVFGICKAIASADLSIGDSVAISADGRIAAAVTTPGTANLGTVLLDNSAANGYATITVNCMNMTR